MLLVRSEVILYFYYWCSLSTWQEIHIVHRKWSLMFVIQMCVVVSLIPLNRVHLDCWIFITNFHLDLSQFTS